MTTSLVKTERRAPRERVGRLRRRGLILRTRVLSNSFRMNEIGIVIVTRHDRLTPAANELLESFSVECPLTMPSGDLGNDRKGSFRWAGGEAGTRNQVGATDDRGRLWDSPGASRRADFWLADSPTAGAHPEHL